MNTRILIWSGAVVAATLFVTMPAVGADACRPWGISTSAQVKVSDGQQFRITTAFHGPTSAAYMRPDTQTTIAVDGAASWIRQGDKAQAGRNFHKLFALGHQFHAFVLYFEELVTDARPGSVMENGAEVVTEMGDYPYGGAVHKLTESDHARPRALRFDFPDRPPIWAYLKDWREAGDAELPYQIVIDDAERTFDYQFSEINLNAGNADWFAKEVAAPALDPVQVHRLHRAMLVAHCDGDAQRLAAVTLPGALSVNGGSVTTIQPSEMATRFGELFQRLNYREYVDLSPPIIEVAQNGDLAWAAVQVRAAGVARQSTERFDDQWAWVILARKHDGVWMHAGNASNRMP